MPGISIARTIVGKMMVIKMKPPLLTWWEVLILTIKSIPDLQDQRVKIAQSKRNQKIGLLSENPPNAFLAKGDSATPQTYWCPFNIVCFANIKSYSGPSGVLPDMDTLAPSQEGILNISIKPSHPVLATKFSFAVFQTHFNCLGHIFNVRPIASFIVANHFFYFGCSLLSFDLVLKNIFDQVLKKGFDTHVTNVPCVFIDARLPRSQFLQGQNHTKQFYFWPWSSFHCNPWLSVFW